jgi:tetratricopeptide (TPR) repeat protein
MMPAAGHLEHMPAHIMQRVGRYEHAAEANRKGVAADLAYFARNKPLDYYVMYTAHNYQFLAFSAATEGRLAETIEAARQSRALVSDDMLLTMPGSGMDRYVGELYAAMVRFGMWDDILAEPAPNPKLIGLTGAYLYAQTAALAAKGRVEDAKASLAELEKASAGEDAAGLNRVRDVLAVAVLDAKARMALAESKVDEALGLLREAVGKEDALAYSEPADWFFPTRHLLGVVPVKAGRAADTEPVYRDDLRRHPNNGWALFGLAQSLKMLGRAADANAAEQQFDIAWKNADVTMSGSAF